MATATVTAPRRLPQQTAVSVRRPCCLRRYLTLADPTVRTVRTVDCCGHAWRVIVAPAGTDAPPGLEDLDDLPADVLLLDVTFYDPVTGRRRVETVDPYGPLDGLEPGWERVPRLDLDPADVCGCFVAPNA